VDVRFHHKLNGGIGKIPITNKKTIKALDKDYSVKV
jgi:hypothetical protein